MRQRFYPLLFLSLLLLTVVVVWSGCGVSLKLPKHATIQSEQPPTYYLGQSPEVYVVGVEGAFRPTQDALINELRNQSMSLGYFTVENRIDEGIRFDVRRGRLVMTGEEVPVDESSVFVKARIAPAMGDDGRTTITRKTGFLNTEEETIRVYMTRVPVAFTVARGHEVLMNERRYDGEVWWPLDEGYPERYQRYEAAMGAAVEQFLEDVTPRTASQEVKLDYHSDEEQQPILDAALDGQVKEAAAELRDYVDQHPNSASAVYNLAVLTDALGQYERALEYYDRAISLGGKDYYTEAKTQCMRRLSERREMEETSRRTARSAEEAQLGNTLEEHERTALQSERPGDGGEDTAWVQQTLNELGYDCGVVDGVMGPNTRSCIRAFQEDNDLEVTGAVDQATYEQMLAHIR